MEAPVQAHAPGPAQHRANEVTKGTWPMYLERAGERAEEATVATFFCQVQPSAFNQDVGKAVSPVPLVRVHTLMRL